MGDSRPPAEGPAPGGREPGGDEHERIRIPRRHELPDLESTEIVRGAKPGARFARVVRAGERRFERAEAEGIIRATDRATAPRTPAQRWWRRVRRVAVGSPISSEQLEEQRLPKWKALAVFSSDVLSSSAYATDEMLIVLAAAGAAALAWSVPIAAAVILLLAIVTFSYRQTVRAYPNGGGAYIVARENFGDAAGVTAAAGLSVGYVMTVAVSIAAGVFAVVSAFPELENIRVPLAIGAVGIVTLLNLRGIRESGTIFAIPTYGFILAFTSLLVVGFIRVLLDPDLRAADPPGGIEETGAAIGAFLILQAFSRGSAALTGTEAISNGVPAFQKPEARNAAMTLLMMAIILGSLFFGITLLARLLEVEPSHEMSVPAQLGRTVFGETPMFYIVQGFTALILFLAANTAYADFPRLGSILARDRFLPHTFLFRGDRLAFSNGIIALGIASSGLLVIFGADVNRLIPLYAFGVFLSFTLSQSGMVRHWLRHHGAGWRRSMVINGLGAAATAVVAAIVGGTNFVDGAWISMTAIALYALALWVIYRHLSGVERRVEVQPGSLVQTAARRQTVIVPVDRVSRVVLRTVEYARTISPNVRAIHVTDDPVAGNELKQQWESMVLDVPLVVIHSPYRSFVLPVLSYLDALERQEPGHFVTVVLPEIRAVWPWQRFLHNQSSQRLKRVLLDRPNTVIVDVPYHLGATPMTDER